MNSELIPQTDLVFVVKQLWLNPGPLPSVLWGLLAHSSGGSQVRILL